STESTQIRVNFLQIISHINKSVSYASKREFDLAHNEIRLALEIDSKYADTYSALGRVYKRESNYPEALKNFLLALGLDHSIYKVEDVFNLYSFIENSNEDALEFINKQIMLKPMQARLYE